MIKTFSIDAQEFSAALARTKAARTNDEKGKSLEHLAKLLFEGIPFVSCRHTNLRTASAEIDLVFFSKGYQEATIFDEIGHYFLVECKNWKDPVGAKHVRDFVGKMQQSRVQLGVLVAPPGVSGDCDGRDALYEIRHAYDQHGLYVVVVSKEQLELVEKGEDFYQILQCEIEMIRFRFVRQNGFGGA